MVAFGGIKSVSNEVSTAGHKVSEVTVTAYVPGLMVVIVLVESPVDQR